MVMSNSQRKGGRERYLKSRRQIFYRIIAGKRARRQNYEKEAGQIDHINKLLYDDLWRKEE